MFDSARSTVFDCRGCRVAPGKLEGSVMAQSGGFDISKLSTPSKILLGGGIVYLIDLFLPWQRLCFLDICGSASGMEGIGVLNLLLVVALVVWEGLAFSSAQIQAPRAPISAALAGAIVVFTLLKIVIDNEAIYIFAWVGLVLALVIAYGGWMRWQDHQTGGVTAGGGLTPPPPPGPGDGFTG
jgi:hypothetical protein